jgi:predicted nucleic acid-binding protein
VTAGAAIRRRSARVRERPAGYALGTGPIVVDASMAFFWFANEPDVRGAARLLESDSTLLAPDVMAVEAANAWWKKLRRREMDISDVEEGVTHLLALEIEWVASAALLRPAARLAADLVHPVYDCIYLVLAASRSAALATADERLQRAAQRVGIGLWRPRR